MISPGGEQTVSSAEFGRATPVPYVQALGQDIGWAGDLSAQVPSYPRMQERRGNRRMLSGEVQ